MKQTRVLELTAAILLEKFDYRKKGGGGIYISLNAACFKVGTFFWESGELMFSRSRWENLILKNRKGVGFFFFF